MVRENPPLGQDPAKTSNERRELITSTGMRFVGKAADLLSGKVGAAVEAAMAPKDILYASRLSVRALMSSANTVDVVLSVLNQTLSPHRRGGPTLSPDNTADEHEGRFHRVFWDTFRHGRRWAGILTWIHSHPVLGGIPCTTRVALSTMDGGDVVDLLIHVGASGGPGGVRGIVGAGQAHPTFLEELNRVAALSFGGSPASWQELTESEIDAFVRRVLLSEQRTHPVAILAPVEPSSLGEPPQYLVSPEQVARELLGLAHLYVLDRHPTTFALSDSLGDKRLSCFRGALRVYHPDFSCADDPMSHPLFLAGRVEDPVERVGLAGLLGLASASRFPLRDPVEGLREAAAPPRPAPKAPASGGSMAGKEETPGEPESEAPSALPSSPPPAAEGTTPGSLSVEQFAEVVEMLLSGLDDRLDQLAGLQERMIDEVSRLRTATVVRAANSAAVERRLTRLEGMIRWELAAALGASEEPLEDPATRVGGEDESEESEQTLVSVLQHAETEFSSDLLILDSALRSAEDSPYEDIERVALNLKAMADLARRRQEGRLGMSLREAFSEAGIDYRGFISPSTSKQMREQYKAILPDGRETLCYEHIVLGTSFDPRYCLRIYFTSRADGESRFVIAHVGRHFTVKRTN